MFINHYLLHLYLNKLPFPKIDINFVKSVLKVVGYTNSKAGRKGKKSELQTFYEKEFKQLITIDNVPIRPCYTNRSYLHAQLADEMLTCIKTNLTTHFEDYIIRYINLVYKYPQQKYIKDNFKTKENRKEQYKILNKDLRDIKYDILSGKIEKSDKKYHNWINENLNLIRPKYSEPIYLNNDIKNSKRTDLYYQHAFYINSKIAELKGKPYQVIPLRKSVIPKSIKLNSNALAEIFGDVIVNNERLYKAHNKSDLIHKSRKYGNYLWNNFIKVEMKSIFKMKNHCFYREIKTDGFYISLLFIDKRYKNKNYGDKIESVPDEIVYNKVEDLTRDECIQILKQNYNFASLDPGSRTPICLEDENGNEYEYSAFRRRYETYGKKYQEILYNNKKNNGIFEKETEFSKKVCSRTMDIEKFKLYITEKLKFNQTVSPFYHNILYRKLNFRKFVYTKKSDAKIVADIKRIFEKDKKVLIFYGNWNGSCRGVKGRIPVPTKHIKNLLFKNFKCMETDEYFSSQVYYKTKEKLENVIVRNKRGKKIKLHEILRPKSIDNKVSSRFIQRDRNSRKNLLYIGKYYLENQDRPKEYKRANSH